jgi:ferredoxin--NADP+ reductase
VIGPDIVHLEVGAPRVADHAQAGQFVIVRTSRVGERIPLTLAGWDPSDGSITLVVQAAGRTTQDLVAMSAGDELADVLGPLGAPTAIAEFGTCVVVVGGVGAAIGLPVAGALVAAGNRVTTILGGRTSDHCILRDAFLAAGSELVVTTEDGSAGRRGLVTDALAEMMDQMQIDRVVTAGPVPMMQAVAESTRPEGIPTIASLNPIMVDGTGMCGGCRVRVGGEIRFACVDGPDFDAHLVDFDGLAARNRAYRTFESCQLDRIGAGDA